MRRSSAKIQHHFLTMNPPEINQLTGLQRFTANAKQAVIAAHEIAVQHKNEEVLPVHLFLALIANPPVIIRRVLERVNIDSEQTTSQLNRELTKQGVAETNAPVFSEQIKDLINKSFLVAEKFNHVYVGSEHLLLAMLELEGEPFISELRNLGLTPEAVSELALEVGNYPPGILSQQSAADREVGGDEEEGDLPFFGRDMNQQAAKGEFLNITGRDAEIERLIHILSRKTKNNPILVGDAGVGKTAVVQGLSQRINRGEVPGSFIGKKVIALDISAVIAGARVRGDVEERILGLINEAIDSQDKILFIDEIHMIVGAGGQGRQDPMDIGNILKPYLTDSNLRLIGATTVQEYRRYFDDDPALSRRFQPIMVEELDKASAIEVVKSLRHDFENYHDVKIKDEAVVEAVNLSDKFIADRYLPDKAIDLIDEAAASVKIGRELQIEPALSQLGDKLLQAQRNKDLAMSNQDFKSAARFRDQEEKITDEIADLMEGRHIYSPRRKVVDRELIRKIVVDWTKIPIAAGNIDSEVLQKLDQKLASIIVGQDQVLASVSAMLKRSHVGIGDADRPLASFLFLGPTGVGKTALAKAIAAELFGSGELLYQINMSEFMEMHSVAKLIGSPPGYVGYQEGGQLTEYVRRRPYSVILFDEVEKAHPDVLNILLQILEEGELADGKGRKASFRNTVIVLTSNIGAEEVSRDAKLGFDIELDQIKENELDQAFEEMRENLLETLKDEVRPELLNRIDEIAVFRGLNEDDCLEISRLQLHALRMSLLEQAIDLRYSATLAKLVNEKGYSKEYGARNIRRTIQELVENPLADYLITTKKKPPKKGLLRITVKTKGGEISFD